MPRKPNTLKVNADALWAGSGELLREALGAVVDAGVEPKLLDGDAAFLCPASNADNTAALELCDLSDHRADRSGCSGHNHGFARLGLPIIKQAHVRGRSRMPNTPSAHDGCFICELSRTSPLRSEIA